MSTYTVTTPGGATKVRYAGSRRFLVLDLSPVRTGTPVVKRSDSLATAKATALAAGRKVGDVSRYAVLDTAGIVKLGHVVGDTLPLEWEPAR